MRTLPLATAVALAATLLAGCSADPAPRAAEPSSEPVAQGSDVSSSCMAIVEYDGREYTGYGQLERQPATTGRVETGTIPGCDDGGGDARAETVEVAELADVPITQAVLVNGGFFLAMDEPFPEQARVWFTAPTCESDEQFELSGDWISVQGPRKTRFDGDLRPPYRAGVRVTDAPEPYLGATIMVHATEETDPGLGPRDVKTALWRRGGQLVADVRCEQGRFVAISLRSTPGE